MIAVLGAVPAHAESPVYWKDQCGGVITWSSTGGKKKIVRQTVIVLDAAMPHYTFKEVPASDTSANIQITMNAGVSYEYYGLAWLFTSGSTILGVDVEIYNSKNRTLTSKVLLHELFHAVGIDHINNRPSLMNSPFYSRGPYKADWVVLRNQDALCS